MIREELIAKYNIIEEGLQALVKDLLALPDNSNNRVILQKALKGIYSDFGSSVDMPRTELQTHLAAAKKTEPAYEALLQEAYKGTYDHDTGAKLVAAFEQSFYPRLFMKGATVKVEVKEEQAATPGPSNS
ncbi:MAG: hypothetical protein P4L65_00510 [Legionella sp.]|nr:hypothetical protein [Legionella sp.]